MMLVGVPCFAKTCDKKIQARSSASILQKVGMNSAILVRWHTTTRIVSRPSDKGSPSMKYIEIESQGCLPMYCTTAPLDGYVMLLDRTPRTRTMTSHSICSKNFCDTWYTHPKKYYLLSVHLLPSGLVSIWIGSVRATHHGQSVPLAIVHGSRDLGPTCGTYYCGGNMEDVVGEMDNRILKETKCHSETIEVPLMEKCI